MDPLPFQIQLLVPAATPGTPPTPDPHSWNDEQRRAYFTAAPGAPPAPDPHFDLYTWDLAQLQAQPGLVALGQHTVDYYDGYDKLTRASLVALGQHTGEYYPPEATTALWLRYGADPLGVLTTYLSLEGDWPKGPPIVLIWRDDVAPQFCNQARITWSPRSGCLSTAYPPSACGANAWEEGLAQARAFLAQTGGLLIQYDFARRQPVGEWLAPVGPAAPPDDVA